MSLRTRLVLAAAYLLLVVVVVLEVPLALTLRNRVEADFRTRIVTLSAILASQINDDIGILNQNPPPDPGTLADPEAFIVSVVDSLAAEADVPIRILVVDAEGLVVADSDHEAAPGTLYATEERPEFDAVLGQSGSTTIYTQTRFSDQLGTEILVVAAPILHNRAVEGAVRVTAQTGTINSQVYRSWIGLGLIGFGVIVVGLALAYVLATSLARPVERLQSVAKRLGGGDMDARAQPEGPKEVADLGRSFNQMAGALSANIVAQQDFVANASHQLRTPLTGLRLRLEAIEGEGGFAAAQALRAGAEVDRLERLVRDLLELARASTGATTGSSVELSDLARGAVERWTGPAEQAGKRLRLALDGPAVVWADPADLQHVVDNLIENAVRYAPEGTEITVGAGSDAGAARLVVADDGPGIPAEDRARIFERFYRGSAGRRSGPGTGLGLAIVSELVHRWGGDVRLAEGPGTRIEATFPPKTAKAGRGGHPTVP